LASAAPIELMCAATPSAAASASRNSTSVISGSCSISSAKKSICGASLPQPVFRPRRFGSRHSPSRTFFPQRAAVARLTSKVRPAAAALFPPAIKRAKRSRRSIDNVLHMQLPPFTTGTNQKAPLNKIPQIQFSTGMLYTVHGVVLHFYA
jgi:hypothetical protein